MLQTMRHLAQSWVFKGLMMFLIISFGIWGIGDIFRGNPLQRTVAKTGKITITVQMLDRIFEQTLTRARGMFGPDFNAQKAKHMGLYDQTLDKLIERADLEQDVERLGIGMDTKQVVDSFATRPEFRGKDGKFNKDLFRQLIAQSNMSESNFLDAARKELTQKQLFDALKSGGDIPETIVENVYRARGQKHILDVVTVKNAGFGDVPPPDDKTLQDFYQQNGQTFMAPEYRALTIIRLSTVDMAKDITVSDTDLKKEYDAKSAEFTHPERRDLVQVVLQDEGKAKLLLTSATLERSDLAAAAKKAGFDAVPLEQVEEKSFLPALAKPVFALAKGQISEPIKSDLGWHVVQVVNIEPAGTPDFESVKDKLRDNIKHDTAVESVTRMVNELDDQLAASHALEDIADGMKLRLVKIPELDEKGKTPAGQDPAELPDAQDVLKAAFEQGSGEVSPVLDDRQGNYVVVRTDEVMPAAVPPFEKIKDRVTAAWKTAEQTKRAAAEAETIAKAMREGNPASSFASTKGVDVRASKPISMLEDNDPDLPQTVSMQIFKMKKGDVITLPLPDRQLVLRLATLTDADPAADKDALNRIKVELGSQMPDELTAQYTKYLRVLFPVEIDQSLLDSLRQQGG